MFVTLGIFRHLWNREDSELFFDVDAFGATAKEVSKSRLLAAKRGIDKKTGQRCINDHTNKNG